MVDTRCTIYTLTNMNDITFIKFEIFMNRALLANGMIHINKSSTPRRFNKQYVVIENA